MEENAQADSGKEQHEEVDIYEDICDFDLGDEIEKLKNENKKLERQIHNLNENIISLNSTVADLEKTRNNLEQNISSLFLTAKAEIERKNRTIEELRLQLDSNHTNKSNSGYTKRRDRESDSSETSKAKRYKYENTGKNDVSDTESKSDVTQGSAPKHSSDRHRHTEDDNKHRPRSQYTSDRLYDDRYEVRSKYSNERYKDDDRYASRNKYADKYNSYADDGYSSRSKNSYERYPNEVEDRGDPRIRHSNDRYYNRSNKYFNDERYSAYERESKEYMWNQRSNVRDRLTYDRESCRSGVEGQSKCVNSKSTNQFDSINFRNEERRSPDRTPHLQSSSEITDYASWRKHREAIIETTKNTVGSEEGNVKERRSVTPESSWLLEHDETLIETKNTEMDAEEQSSASSKPLLDESEKQKVKPAKKRLKMLEEMEKKIKRNKLSQASTLDSREHSLTWAGKSKGTLTRSRNDDSDRHSVASSRSSRSDKNCGESKPVKEKVSSKTTVELDTKMDEKTNQTKGKISRTNPMKLECLERFPDTNKSVILPQTNQNTSVEKVEDISVTKENTKKFSDKLEDETHIPKKSSSEPKPLQAEHEKSGKGIQKNKDGKVKDQENKKKVLSDTESKEKLSKDHLKTDKAGKNAIDSKTNSKGKNEEQKSKRGIEKVPVGKNEHEKDAKQSGVDENTNKSDEEKTEKKIQPKVKECMVKSSRDCSNLDLKERILSEQVVKVDRKEERNKEKSSKSDKKIEEKTKDKKNLNALRKCKNEGNIVDTFAVDGKVVRVIQKGDSEESQKPTKHSTKQSEQHITTHHAVKESVNTDNKGTSATYSIGKDSKIEKQRDQLEQKEKAVENAAAQLTRQTQRVEVASNIEHQSKNSNELKANRRQSTYIDQDVSTFHSEQQPKHDISSSSIELKRSTHVDENKKTVPEHHSENKGKCSSFGLKQNWRQSSFQEQDGNNMHIEHQSKDCSKHSSMDQNENMTRPEHQSENSGKSSRFEVKLKLGQSTFAEGHTHTENQSQDIAKSSGVEFKPKQKSMNAKQDIDITHHEQRNEKNTHAENQNDGKSSSFEVKLKQRQSTFEEQNESNTHAESQDAGKSSSLELKIKQKQSTFEERNESKIHAENQDAGKSSSFELKLKQKQSTFEGQSESYTHAGNQSEGNEKPSDMDLISKQIQTTNVDQDDNRTYPEHQDKSNTHAENQDDGKSSSLKLKQNQSTFEERNESNTHAENQDAGKSSSFELKLKRRQSTFEERNESNTHAENQDAGKSSSFEIKIKQKPSTFEDRNGSKTHSEKQDAGKSSSSELKLKRRQSTFEERDESYTHAGNQSEVNEKSSGKDLISKQIQSSNVDQDDNRTYPEHQSENDRKSSSFDLKLKLRQSTFEEQGNRLTHTENQSEDISKSSSMGFIQKQIQSTNVEHGNTNTLTENPSEDIGKSSVMEFEPKQKQSMDIAEDDTTHCEHHFVLKQIRRKSSFEERDDSNPHTQNQPECIHESSHMELKQKQGKSTNLDQNDSTTLPEHQTENNDKSSCIVLKRKRRQSLFIQPDDSNTHTQHQSEEIGKSCSDLVKRKRRQSTYVEQDDSISENKAGNSLEKPKEMENKIDGRERPVEAVTKQDFLSKHISKSPKKVAQRMTRSKLKVFEEETKVIEISQNNDLKESKKTDPIDKEVALKPGEQRTRVNEVRRRIKFHSKTNVSQQTAKNSENIQGHTTAKDKPTSCKKNSKFSDLFGEENSSDTSSDSLEDSGKASDSTEKIKKRTCKSKTKRPSTESLSTSSSSDEDLRVGKSKIISRRSSSESEIIEISSDNLLNTYKATHKLIEIKNVEKESIVKIKPIGSSDSSVSDDATTISAKGMLTEKRIDNLIKSCIEKYISTDSCNEPEKISETCTTEAVAEIKQDNSTHENVTTKVTESKIKMDVTVTTAATATIVRAEKPVATNSKDVTNSATISSSSSGNTRPLTRRRITPIPVKDDGPHCSFQNILEKPCQPETIHTTTPVGISPLHLTHDGEIPVLHLDDNHINNMPTEVNIIDKNIMTLLDSMNISNIDCDIPKFKSVSSENTTNSVVNASAANDSGLTFENIMQKVASPPTKTQSVDSGDKDIVSCATLHNESVSTNRTASSVEDSSAQPKTTSTPIQRRRRRCRLVIIG